jgi:hypothetical protein
MDNNLIYRPGLRTRSEARLRVLVARWLVGLTAAALVLVVWLACQ